MATLCQLTTQGQVTNFANFTPVCLTLDRADGPEEVGQGIFISFTSDVGRIYRFESSTTLTNWTLVEEVIGTDTNMEFYIPITNMTVIPPGTGTNGGGPPPGFEGMMMAGGESATSGTRWVPRPPPLPWDPAYQARPRTTSAEGLSSESGMLMEMDSPSTNPPPRATFYRVVCPEDRIQFPDFEDFTEQFMYFDVWTSLTGTYTLTLYQDSTLVYSNRATVPSGGHFGVYDPDYDPAYWPYTGFYSGSEFRVNVTVTNTNGASATATARKTIRRRTMNRAGITIQQFGALGSSGTLQEDVDDWMHSYFLKNYQAARQYSLGGAVVDPYVDVTGVPRIYATNDWASFKTLLCGPNRPVPLTDLYYFGHGSKDGIGSNSVPNANIQVRDLQNSLLKTNPMFYVFLDGCSTAKNAQLLKAFIGYGEKVSRQDFIDRGLTPAFGAGWKKQVGSSYLLQGTLRHRHFCFVWDFDFHLTHRDFGGNGYFDHTFEDAINFAKAPHTLGFDRYIETNAEGDLLDWFGCYDCFFDHVGL
ncbi:MAG: hypothetical protein HZA90_14115 [Verrucomicrobia bacterium]|nr:hypothetical protein [Verrucomicrobiota bacterium]